MSRFLMTLFEYGFCVWFSALAVWLGSLVGLKLDLFAIVACAALYRAIWVGNADE